ncbi:MAG: OB-fold domain-containing protein [Thermoanaerobaculia bacterium]
MIARLSGTVLDLRTDRLVLDVGGVGYDLAIPLGTFSALPPTGERRRSTFTRTCARTRSSSSASRRPRRSTSSSA